MLSNRNDYPEPYMQTGLLCKEWPCCRLATAESYPAMDQRRAIKALVTEYGGWGKLGGGSPSKPPPQNHCGEPLGFRRSIMTSR